MKITEEWNKMEDSDPDLARLIEQGVPGGSSTDPLSKIKRNLLANGMLGIVISFLYIGVVFRFPVWPVVLLLSVVIAFTGWATVKALLLYADIQPPMAGDTLLRTMERHYYAVKKWMRVQQSLGLLVYPASVTAGFLVGASIGGDVPMERLLHNPAVMVVLPVVVVVMVPACYYLARWMCQKAFGFYLEQLKANIDQLNSEK